jgi:hypothetical protein
VSANQSKPAYDLHPFAEPALLPSEDRQAYERLLNDIRGTIHPADIFERCWVTELAHQTCEISRFRRMTVQLLISGKQMALEKVLRHLIHGTDSGRPQAELNGDKLLQTPMCTSERLAMQYMQRDPHAIDAVNEYLRQAALTWEIIEAEAAAMRSLELQRITQLLAKAESRRNATLKAIERHRAGLGAELQEAMAKFETDELDKVRAAKTEATPKLAA